MTQVKRSIQLAGSLLLLAVSCWQSNAAAQITVGYRNPIFVNQSRTREQRQGVRTTRRFEVSGINVKPLDGSLIYDEDTIWTISEPGKPFSLTVLDQNPLVETRQTSIQAETSQAARTERVFVQVTGPAAEALRSPFENQQRQEDLLLGVPPSLTSVFGP